LKMFLIGRRLTMNSSEFRHADKTSITKEIEAQRNDG
jgi:hypothetical protein